uniref:Uncharacterized protein n=1 Tax=Oryza brachyantha TaxID=4533 RepID=J3M853_ORYBR
MDEGHHQMLVWRTVAFTETEEGGAAQTDGSPQGQVFAHFHTLVHLNTCTHIIEGLKKPVIWWH